MGHFNGNCRPAPIVPLIPSQKMLGNTPMTDHKLQAFDSNAMAWKESVIPALGKAIFVKPFVEDPETGVTVRMAKYLVWFMNAWHTHPCHPPLDRVCGGR